MDPDPHETDRKLAATFGKAIESARRARRWSQEQLAERSDVSKNHVGFLERGERLPSVGILVRLARILGLSLDEVLLDAAPRRRAASEMTSLVTSIDPQYRPLVVDFLRVAATHRSPSSPAKRRR